MEVLLARAKGGSGEGRSQMSWHGRMEALMKPEASTVLAHQRREKAQRSAAFKRAFECCGTECSQRKRFKAIFEDGGSE